MTDAHENNEAEAALDTLTREQLEKAVTEYDENKQVSGTRNKAACLTVRSCTD
jgi:hypothetical protein